MTRDSLFETRGWWPDWSLAQYVALVEHTKEDNHATKEFPDAEAGSTAPSRRHNPVAG